MNQTVNQNFEQLLQQCQKAIYYTNNAKYKPLDFLAHM